MGNFDFAAAIRRLLDYLRCPRCGASNRPDAYLIVVDEGHAHCNVCAYGWIVSQGEVR